MSDGPFVCVRCGAPLELPTAPDVLDVTCEFCKTQTPVPQVRREALRHEPPSTPARPSPFIWVFAVSALAGVAAMIFWSTQRSADVAVSAPVQVAVPPPPTPTVPAITTATAAPNAGSRLGALVATFGGKGTGAGLFTDARTLAVDPEGNVYVGEYKLGRVQKFDDSGKFVQALEILPLDGAGYMFGLACDFAGNLYVSRVHEVLKLSAKDGTLLATVKEKKRADAKHARPDEMCARQIAVDAANHLYVLSDCTPEGVSTGLENPHSLVKLDGKGSAIGHYKGVGADLASLAVDGAGTIYVAHGLDHEVFVHDTKGTFTNKWGQSGKEPGDFAGQLEGLTTDGHGHVYVLDSNGVGVFDTNGKPRGRFGAWGRAIAAAPKGDVYVLENDGIVKRYRVTLPSTP